VGWSGTWTVDGTTETRLVTETLPGQLTLQTNLPVEGASRTLELTGSATDKGLELAALWIDGIGFVGALENVPLKQKHSVSLDATATQGDDGEVVALVHYLVDGREVRAETWRGKPAFEWVRFEAGDSPLVGAFDPKETPTLTAKFRVVRGSLAIHARIEVDAGHPFASFYGPRQVVFEASLGTYEPGEHGWNWDGRDATNAKRLALAGPYRLVLEASLPAAQPAPQVSSTPADGLPAPGASPAAPSAPSVSTAVECFTVAPPHLELMCSNWAANYNHFQQPEWNEGPALEKAGEALAGRLFGGASGFLFQGARVLDDSLVAASYLKKSSVALLETHGNVDSVWFFKGDPTKEWHEGDPEDGITGQYFSPGDLKDLHFAFALICDGGIPDDKGHSFVSSLRDAGCDVAIGFSAPIAIVDGRKFRERMLGLVETGTPVEKAARDTAREIFAEDNVQTTHFLWWKTGTRLPTDDEMDKLIDQERNTPSDPNVNNGIKSLASCMVVERGKGIPADESMWPPRYGNSTN
jgi:hypothetical protein